MGRVRQGRVYGVPKMELRLRLTWICSEGLGTNSGQGETGIGVPVWCYTECNSASTPDLVVLEFRR